MKSVNQTLSKIQRLIGVVFRWLQSVGECDCTTFREAMLDRNIDPAQAMATVKFLSAIGVAGIEGTEPDRLHIWAIGGAA